MMKDLHPPHPGSETQWTVWSDALVDPLAAGDEAHAKSCVLEKRVVIYGDPEQYVCSPDGGWYRWDGQDWAPRPEGGGVVWCEADDGPAVSCAHLYGACSAPEVSGGR
jgi:hypothetical protein